jgi:cysteine desulfurase
MPSIALVAVMAANNETGIIQPWQEIANFCDDNNLIFFSDTTQFIGKSEFDFSSSKMDFAVLSGHKIGAITGSGILLSKNPFKLKPLIFGGSQEAGTRGGTQNYIGIETLAVALDAFSQEKINLEKVKGLKLNFEANIKKIFPQVVIIGDDAERLATTTMIAFPGIHGQAVQIELESNNIFVTTSAACSDNEPETSKILKAMEIDDKVGRGVVRISFGTNTNEKSYLTIEKALLNAYQKLKKIHSY